jgi:hypothetical protein
MVASNRSLVPEVFKYMPDPFVTSLVPLTESTEDFIVQRAPTLSPETLT